MPPAVVAYNYETLPLFSPEGLRAYLPAYLFAALDSDNEDVVRSMTVYALCPPEGKPDAWFKGRYAGFTPAQRDAVRQFLVYVREEMADPDLDQHARVALDSYWAKEPESPWSSE